MNVVVVGGRYIKKTRDVSHTPLDQFDKVTGERKKFEMCVSGIIEEAFKKCFNEEQVDVVEIKFNSAGREDSDVRMLGNGRPFVIKISFVNKGSNQFKESDDFLKRIDFFLDHSRISLLSLCFFPKENDVSNILKSGEEHRNKTYRCLVHTLNDISISETVNRKPDGSYVFVDCSSNQSPLTISQLTPVRVSHRRALSSRKKLIFFLSLQRIEYSTLHSTHTPDSPISNAEFEAKGFFYVVTITTQAGTYIKEFVHGDFGRTTPSLGDLICHRSPPPQLLLLDVMHIDLDFPPQVDQT